MAVARQLVGSEPITDAVQSIQANVTFLVRETVTREITTLTVGANCSGRSISRRLLVHFFLGRHLAGAKGRGKTNKYQGLQGKFHDHSRFQIHCCDV